MTNPMPAPPLNSPREPAREAALLAPPQARLAHLFRHTPAQPDDLCLQALMQRYRGVTPP
jgi:hypothetical protein